MRKFYALILSLLVFVGAAMTAHAQMQMVYVLGSLVDSSGNYVQSGTITFTPVDNRGNPISFKAALIGGGGAAGYGQAIKQPVSATVSAGQFFLTLADTSQTQPLNVCFAVTAVDNVTGESLLDAKSYRCVQPSSNYGEGGAGFGWCYAETHGSQTTTCDFNNYSPNNAMLPVTTVGSSAFNGGAIALATTFGSTVTLNADPTANLQAATKQYVDAHTSGAFNGGAVTNPITLPADPTANLQAATKQYVDAHAGGTFTGGTVANPITLPADPTTNLEAATKQYDDTKGATSTSSRIVYSKSYFADLSDFTVEGTSPIVSSGGIVFNTAAGGTGSGGFSGYTLVLKNSYTLDDHIDVQANFVATTPLVNGIFLGKVQPNGGGFVLVWQQNGSHSELDWWPQGGGAIGASTQSNTITTLVNSGDIIRLTYSQRGATFVGKLEDLTTGQSSSVTIAASLVRASSANFLKPATSSIEVGSLGGTYTMMSFQVLDRSPQRPAIAAVGDSKLAGYDAGVEALTFERLMPYGPVTSNGGPGDTTANVLLDVPWVIAQKPSAVLLSVGSNDIRSGVPSATWQANYSSIVSQLKAAGIRVVHLLPIPENTTGPCVGVDQSALKTYIQSTFSGDTQIDPSSGWDVGTMVDSGDCVHPTPDGSRYLAQSIANSGAFSAYYATRYDGTEPGFGQATTVATGGGDFTLIATQTPTGTNTATLTAPTGYKDLKLVVRGASSAATFASVYLTFNGDTGAHYDFQNLQANNATTTSNGSAADIDIFLGWLPGATSPTGEGSSSEADIYDYAGSTFQKRVDTSSGLKVSSAASGLFINKGVGWWDVTSPITSITVKLDSGNFVAGDTISLYGRN